MLISLLAAICAVAAVDPKPTSQPTLDDFKQAVVVAEQTARQAEDAAVAAFHHTPEYRDAKAQADAAKERLDAARASGTAQEKLDASRLFVSANESIKKMEKRAAATDPQAVAAMRAADQARRALAIREENDPVLKAVREHRVVAGMTEEQAKKAIDDDFYPDRKGFREIKKTNDSTLADGTRLVTWDCAVAASSAQVAVTGDASGSGAIRSVTIRLREGKVIAVSDTDHRLK